MMRSFFKSALLTTVLFLLVSFNVNAIDSDHPIFMDDRTIVGYSDEYGDINSVTSTSFFVPEAGEYFATLLNGEGAPELFTPFNELEFYFGEFFDSPSEYFGQGTHTVWLDRGFTVVTIDSNLHGEPETFLMGNYQFNVAPVPEFEVWLMMLLGLGFVFYITRRKKTYFNQLQVA